jgi:type IV pilus assembly protein PilW
MNMNRWTQHPQGGHKGLTLIELMISLALGSFLVLMIIQITLQNRQSARLQEAMAQSQENARFAIEMLSRDIRGADYWGCGGSTLVDFAPLLGAGNTAVVGTYTAQSDTLSLTSSSTTDVIVETDMSTTSQAIQVTPNTLINQCDYVFITDCEHGDLFLANANGSAMQSTGNIPNPQGQACSGTGGVSSGQITHTYSTGDFVLIAKNYLYQTAQISGTSDTTWGYTHRLVRLTNGVNAQPIVGGIERIRFLYGIDTDDDNVVNVYRYADTVTANSEWDEVVAIRYEMVTQSAEPFALRQPEPYWFDGQQVTPTDRRFRRVYSGTVTIRNRVI